MTQSLPSPLLAQLPCHLPFHLLGVNHPRIVSSVCTTSSTHERRGRGRRFGIARLLTVRSRMAGTRSHQPPGIEHQEFRLSDMECISYCYSKVLDRGPEVTLLIWPGGCCLEGHDVPHTQAPSLLQQPPGSAEVLASLIHLSHIRACRLLAAVTPQTIRITHPLAYLAALLSHHQSTIKKLAPSRSFQPLCRSRALQHC